MTYHKCLKPIWKGSKSMADYCNYQSDHICPPITIAPLYPITKTQPTTQNNRHTTDVITTREVPGNLGS